MGVRFAGRGARFDEHDERVERSGRLGARRARRVGRWLAAAGVAAWAFASAPAVTANPTATATAPVQLRIVGGLAGLAQYSEQEEPFWTRELARASGGRMTATIVPFDRAGLRAQEMTSLVEIGAVPFGTALLSVDTGRVPEFGALDLAGAHPDIGSLRASVDRARPALAGFLRERHGIELLGVYTYPAQVLFCRQAFRSLADLRGRRIRTSSATQSDFVNAIGATPVPIGFTALMGEFKGGSLDCAITGALSGHAIGLHQASTHLHTLPISWGLTLFIAHGPTWDALSAADRTLLRASIGRLESSIWDAAREDMRRGVDCNTGRQACGDGPAGKMKLVRHAEADERLRAEVFTRTVLPRWLERCGRGCAEFWDANLRPAAQAAR